MQFLFSHQSTVLKAFAVLANAAPGKTNYDSHVKFIENFKSTDGFETTQYLKELNKIFAGASDKSLGDLMLANLGLTSVFTSAQAQAYIAGNAGNRVGAILNVADIVLNYAGADANVLAAKSALSNKIDFSYNWSTTNAASSNFPSTFDLKTFNLTTAVETLIGTDGNDLFQAYIADNGNTLNSGDNIQGGTGVDTLFADIGLSQSFAITATTSGIETVQIRAQATPKDVANGNNMDDNTVQIDAQRMVGVTQWESTNSRADVLIEDVRILDSQKTKDITIAFVESDPGNVDFGVYFDQHSLRNQSSGNTNLTIKIMDTGAAGQAATAATPLLNNPYDQFKIGINGVLSTIQLDKVEVAKADTYAALLTVFQNALTGTGITVALGADFNVTDPISNTLVTGKTIVLTGGAGAVISELPNSGWYNTTGASVPATSNIYTTYQQGASSVTELVTSTIILDDVGRGSTGGDLVVGGLSVGETSTSRGVERFEIEVRDNSKLQTINSTNNALREVTIKNGVTSKTDDTDGAYSTTVKDEGDLTVNGNAKDSLLVDQGAGGDNQTMAGVNQGAAVGVHQGANAAGFTDVRLIDASAFKGKLAFTAAVTTDSLSKYVNLGDTLSNPASDVAGAGNVNFNVKGANFLYTGGNDNDTMSVTIDSAVAASNTLTGQSDFSIVIDGGAGNDTITTNIGGNETNAWVVDQKQNANIRIETGEGDDTVTTTGGGAVIINTGAGSDTVYADNSGTIGAKWVVNDPTPAILTDLYTGGATKGFMYDGKLTVSFSGANGSGAGGVTAGAADSLAGTTADPYTNGFEVTVSIPTGTNYEVTQLHLNQAIKAAINDDPVLKKLLKAEDGPANTLTIKSLIDGTFNANDIKMTVTSADLTTLNTSVQSTVLAAYKVYAANSAAVIATAQAANAASVTAFNGVAGMDVNQVLGTNTLPGLTVATAVVTQGVTAVKEVFTATFAATTDADTVTFDGLAAHALTAANTAVQNAASYTAFYNAQGAANWVAVDNLNGTVTFTAKVAAAVADVLTANFAIGSGGGGADTTVTVAAPTTQGVNGVKEVFTATISGTSVLGETITFDGATTTALTAAGTSAAAAAALHANADTAWTSAVAGSVVTFTAAAAGAVADVAASAFAQNTPGTNGTISGSESDNTINLGAGTSDVLVMGTGAASNDTVVFTSYDLGKKTIVNFEDTVAASMDKLDFKSYLVDKASASGSVESQQRIATTLNVDANTEANSVTVLNTAVFTATDTFAGLTAAKLLAAVNSTNTGSANFAGLTAATLNAVNTYVTGTTLVGGTGHAVVMVENNANQGEYAVFELTYNGTATNTTSDYSEAKMIGIVDFGNSLTFAGALLA